MTEEFFTQQVPVVRREMTRVEGVLDSIDKENLHLHVGCVDWPLYDPATNLHVRMLEEGYHIDGLDIDADGIQQMKTHTREYGFKYYTHPHDIEKSDYACIVIPDVIEHVDNVAIFLHDLADLGAEGYVLSTPNAMNMRAYVHEGVMYETVHPDHNYWFSPYTLTNCIKKFTHWTVSDVLLVEDGDWIVMRGGCRW